MSVRAPIVLRDADRDDAAALIALWSECAAASQDEGSEAFTQQALWREPGLAEAAARWLDPSRWVVVVVGPAAELKGRLEAVGPVEVVAAGAAPTSPDSTE